MFLMTVCYNQHDYYFGHSPFSSRWATSKVMAMLTLKKNPEITEYKMFSSFDALLIILFCKPSTFFFHYYYSEKLHFLNFVEHLNQNVI